MRALLAAITILIFYVAGCQHPEAPPNTTAEGMAVPNHQPAEGPPVVNVTGRYIFPMAVSGTTSPLTIIDIPAGRPVSFCWSVAGDCAGAKYRLGWDILDYNDDEQWETPWHPFEGGEACGTARTFSFGSHVFAVEVIDADGEKTRAEIRLNIIPEFATGSIDIRPGACPNRLAARSRGLLHTLLLGTDTVDVRDVIEGSIRLGRAQPVSIKLRDVAAPSTDSGECACSEHGADGREDLLLTFRIDDLAGSNPARGPFGPHGQREIVLFLQAMKNDGKWLWASDCVLVPGPHGCSSRGRDRGDGPTTD